MGNATLPSPAQFTPPPPKGFDGWVGPFLRTLNQFLVQTVDALQSLFDSRPRYRTITIATGADASTEFPITLDNPLAAAPNDVHLAKVEPRGRSVILEPVTIIWKLSAKGEILLLSVTGLDDNSSYDVTVAIQ